MPQPSRIYLIIILCVGLKTMAERRVFPPGQGTDKTGRRKSGESFVAGSAGLGEAADDSRSRVTPGDSSGVGGVNARDQEIPGGGLQEAD